MKYKTIGHYKTYNPNQFVYDKISLQEDFPVDKPDAECISELNSRIDEMAKLVYPWLFQEQQPVKVSEWRSPTTTVTEVEFVDRNKPLPVEKLEKATTASILEQDIRRSKTIGELRTWRMLVDKTKDTVLKQAYDEVFAELTKAETVTP